jgi:hypothetical protein
MADAAVAAPAARKLRLDVISHLLQGLNKRSYSNMALAQID